MHDRSGWRFHILVVGISFRDRIEWAWRAKELGCDPRVDMAIRVPGSRYYPQDVPLAVQIGIGARKIRRDALDRFVRSFWVRDAFPRDFRLSGGRWPLSYDGLIRDLEKHLGPPREDERSQESEPRAASRNRLRTGRLPNPSNQTAAVVRRRGATRSEQDRYVHRLLEEGDYEGRFRSRSELALAILWRLVRGGYTEDDILAMSEQYVGLARYVERPDGRPLFERERRRRIEVDVRKVLDFLASTPSSGHRAKRQGSSTLSQAAMALLRAVYREYGATDPRMVQVAIAIANDGGRWRHGYRRLGETAGVSRMTAHRCVRKLIAHGLLETIRSFPRGAPIPWTFQASQLGQLGTSQPTPGTSGDTIGALVRSRAMHRGGLSPPEVASLVAVILGEVSDDGSWGMRMLRKRRLMTGKGGAITIAPDVGRRLVRLARKSGSLDAFRNMRERHRVERLRFVRHAAFRWSEAIMLEHHPSFSDEIRLITSRLRMAA